jgi:hypothetical protein
MRRSSKNHRRTQLRVESLEGKTVLSTVSVMHQVAPHVTASPIAAQAAAFSGTLSGSYSNVDVPGFAHTLSYRTSGTLTSVGSTRLRGTLFVRPGARAGRLDGQLILRNSGGSMIVNVFQSAVPGQYTYKVARARGIVTAFRGGTGELMITQVRSVTVPFFVFGQATLNFTPA